MSIDVASLVQALRDGAEIGRGLWLPEAAGYSVRRVPASELDEDTFVSEFVARNTPVVITGALDGVLVADEWGLEALSTVHGDSVVTVNVTPDGWGDAVVPLDCGSCCDDEGPSDVASRRHLFVKPEERRLRLRDALAWLRRDAAALGGALPAGVPYVSFQNDNLSQELPALLRSLRRPSSTHDRAAPWRWCPWPRSQLDATNIWIGDARSTSSTHKDNYHNLYGVVSGAKQFILLPPPDVLWMYPRRYRSGRYRWCSHSDGGAAMPDSCSRPGAGDAGADGRGHRSLPVPKAIAAAAAANGDGGGAWVIDLDDDDDDDEGAARLGADGGVTAGGVPWLSVNPAAPDLDSFPLAANATPVTVELGPGDVLYLPPLWLHQATQHTLTVAVNWWADMDMAAPDATYHSLLAAVARALAAPAPATIESRAERTP
jgi:hypothetical protein